jgi:hypothetical protein
MAGMGAGYRYPFFFSYLFFFLDETWLYSKSPLFSSCTIFTAERLGWVGLVAEFKSFYSVLLSATKKLGIAPWYIIGLPSVLYTPETSIWLG